MRARRAMATADEIREQIREAEAVLEQRRTERAAASAEVEAANERQRLRRQLDSIRSATNFETMLRDARLRERAGVDQDVAGPAAPGMFRRAPSAPAPQTVPAESESAPQIANCRDVVDGESRSGASKACRGSRLLCGRWGKFARQVKSSR